MSNKGKYLLDFVKDKAFIYSLEEPYDQVMTIKSNTNRIAYVFAFDDVNVFAVAGSKESKDIIFYDASGIKVEAGLNELSIIESNAKSSMNGMVVHKIKMVQGGSNERNFCLVEHDSQEQTIFEYKMADEKKRDWLVFKQVLTIDAGFRIVSGLINDNKVLTHDIENDKFRILNMDMRAYWSVDENMKKVIDNCDNQDNFNFIPSSHWDGMISNQNKQLQLNHAFQTESILLSKGKTHSFKMGINPDKSNEVLVLS